MTAIDDILNDGAHTYKEKNDDYGDSWRMVGEFLSMLAGDGITLDSEEDFISLGLYTRRLDKLARAFNGEFNDDSLNHESVIDSHEDEMVYAAMHSSNQQNRQPVQKEHGSVAALSDVSVSISTNDDED